jgi:hypothetical protein
LSTPNPNNYKDEEISTDESLWQWKLHEDDLFNNRANLFLVAESMFFTAFAALVVGVSSLNSFFALPVILGMAGIWLCFIWYRIGKNQLDYTDDLLREAMKDRAKERGDSGGRIFKIANNLIEERKKRCKTSITDLMLQIPKILTIIWVFVLLFYILHFFPAIL